MLLDIYQSLSNSAITVMPSLDLLLYYHDNFADSSTHQQCANVCIVMMIK